MSADHFRFHNLRYDSSCFPYFRRDRRLRSHHHRAQELSTQTCRPAQADSGQRCPRQRRLDNSSLLLLVGLLLRLLLLLLLILLLLLLHLAQLF